MITTSLFHDTRREKQNKKYPVKLCVNYIHKAKYYSTGIDLTKEEFERFSTKKTSKDMAAVREELQAKEANAKAIIATLKPFSFSTLKGNSPRNRSIMTGWLQFFRIRSAN